MVPKKNRKKELTRLPGKTVQDRALKELNGFVQDYNKLGGSLGIPEELLLGGMKPEQVWLGRGELLNPISGLDGWQVDPVKDSPKFEPGVTIGASTEDTRDRRAGRFSTMKEDSEGNLLNPIPGLVDGGKLWGWLSGQRLTDAYGAKQVNDYLIGGWTRDEKPTVHPKLYETQTEYYEDMDPEGKKERYPSGKWHKAVVPGPDLWGPAAMQRRANHDRRVLESARKELARLAPVYKKIVEGRRAGTMSQAEAAKLLGGRSKKKFQAPYSLVGRQAGQKVGDHATPKELGRALAQELYLTIEDKHLEGQRQKGLAQPKYSESYLPEEPRLLPDKYYVDDHGQRVYPPSRGGQKRMLSKPKGYYQRSSVRGQVQTPPMQEKRAALERANKAIGGK